MINSQGKWAELHFSVAAGTAEQRDQKLLNRWVARNLKHIMFGWVAPQLFLFFENEIKHLIC